MTRPRPHCGRAGTKTQIFRRPLPHPGRAQVGQEARAPPGWEEPARAPKLDHRPQAGQGGRTGARATSHRGGRTAVGGGGQSPLQLLGGAPATARALRGRPGPLQASTQSSPRSPIIHSAPKCHLYHCLPAICRRGRWVSLRLLHLSPHVSPSSPCSLPLSIYSCCVQILASDRCGVKVPGTPVLCDLCGATAICPLPWPAPPFLICATGLTPAVPASCGSPCLPRPEHPAGAYSVVATRR